MHPNPKPPSRVVLVSQDHNLRARAASNGLRAATVAALTTTSMTSTSSSSSSGGGGGGGGGGGTCGGAGLGDGQGRRGGQQLQLDLAATNEALGLMVR